jgi:hypothetical protein
LSGAASDVSPAAISMSVMYGMPTLASVLTAGMLKEFPKHTISSQVPW